MLRDPLFPFSLEPFSACLFHLGSFSGHTKIKARLFVLKNRDAIVPPLTRYNL